MRVAIVNDMRLATEALRRVVCSDARHAVVWTAADGEEAVRLCQRDTPDVVLMDLVMPVMNGAEATRRIMLTSPCPVLVVTATVVGNFSLVCEALGHGAYDAVVTPQLGDRPLAEAGAELLQKLTQVDRINRRGGAGGNLATIVASKPGVAQAVPGRAIPLVALGASTGGPTALAAILSAWPKGFPAGILVVQHIGLDFAAQLAQWLGERSKVQVQLAAAGDRPQLGTVMVAGTEDHLVLGPDRALRYTVQPADYPYRPSVDALFDSLAAHWPTPGVAVLLTGIGRDGAAGLLRLRQAGWHTVAQDQATSVVYGMPQAARELGAASVVLPLGAIAGYVSNRIHAQTSSKP
jgi:two-component system, chemotaxis family, response regulator WspF